MIIKADNNWNQKDELRAFESFIARIKAHIRIKNIIKANRSQIESWNIKESHPSLGVKKFQIISVIFPSHSNIPTLGEAKDSVSMVLQKMCKTFYFHG